MRTLLLSLCLWSAMSTAGDFPIIVDPVVNATPPGAKVTAGYLMFVNETSTAITITGAYSTTIAKVEIHRSFVKDDVAKMELQESISVEPGATIEFAHGSYHLMLMDLTKPLKEGETVDIILITSAGDMMIEMPVQKIGSTPSATEHSSEHVKPESDETMKLEDKMETSHSDKMDADKVNNDEQASSK